MYENVTIAIDKNSACANAILISRADVGMEVCARNDKAAKQSDRLNAPSAAVVREPKRLWHRPPRKPSVDPELAVATIAVICSVDKLRRAARPGVMAGHQYIVPAHVCAITQAATTKNGWVFDGSG